MNLLKKSSSPTQFNLSSRRRRTTVGVCAMAKKSGSRPMEEILRRLPVSIFEIVIFAEKMILEEAVESWPIVDCLIAFHSHGFPLDKAIAYEALRRPFVLNDLRRQYILRDRRKVYETLAKAGVPTPRHAALSRDWEARGLAPKQSLEEYDDQVIVNGITILKPFVEKPVDADDHNIYIYYPMSAGGGSKRLFRKVDNKSSKYYADEHKVRRDGSYIYEEFVDTQGTDVKVYSVGPYYGHAEARKSPTLDGIVLRGDDGKELRYPVILSWIEKDIAFKIYHALKQTVCGFDILRTPDGKHIVCDVNGWSFVKKSRKYYDDCASLLAELMEHRRPPVPVVPLVTAKSTQQRLAGAMQSSSSIPSRGVFNDTSLPRSASTDSLGRKSQPKEKSEIPIKNDSEIYTTTDPLSPTEYGPRKKPERELRCVIAVIRHGDRTPKRKLKVKVRHPRLVAVHTKHAAEIAARKKNDKAFSASLKIALAMPGAGPMALCGGGTNTQGASIATATPPKQHKKKNPSKMEVKIRESKDLRAFAQLVRSVLDAEKEPKRSESYGSKDELHNNDTIRRAHSEHVLFENHHGNDQTQAKEEFDHERLALIQLHDVLEQHIPENTTSLNTALFSGCKLQLKPCEWIDDETAPDGRRTTAVMLVLKWGGVLTELGVDHACALGAHFRRSMYPASDDGAGLLRLHATFRHDLKIRTSDEGRVMKTGAAFTKGLLELEGDISPILVSLIHRGRTDVNMLDRAGNHEAQDLLAAAKNHVEQAFQVDLPLNDFNNGEFLEIAPDGPASVLAALRQIKNPKKALENLYALVDGLVNALEAYCLSTNADPEQKLYMGETLRVWLDSWRDVRSELRKKHNPKKKDDIAKKKHEDDDNEEDNIQKLEKEDWHYDLSKIPEIFDKVRFDAQHNAKTLGLYHTYPRFKELVAQAQLLSQAVAPLEFGGTASCRRDIAWLVSRALLDKIRQDLQTARGASGDANAGLHFQLDDDPQHLADAQIKSSWRAVRSRLYFTSESHLHALLTALRLPADKPPAQLDDANLDENFIISQQARDWLSQIPELSYLSHIVFRLWEDPTYDETNPRRYMVELSFSPGTPFSVGNDESLHDTPDPTENFGGGGTTRRFSDLPDSSDANSDSTLAGHDVDEPPTYPLEAFAYVPCQLLENYISASPHFSSSNASLAHATSTYHKLAQNLQGGPRATTASSASGSVPISTGPIASSRRSYSV